MESFSPLRYKPRKNTSTIIIHDSHTRPDEIWDPVDMGTDMGLLSTGYHFVITRWRPEGTPAVKAGRERDLVGSHTPGHNWESIGICWEGGRDIHGNPAENIDYHQRKLLIRLCAELMDHYGKKLHVLGHSEVQAYRDVLMPRCPYMDMNLLREDIEAYQKGL